MESNNRDPFVDEVISPPNQAEQATDQRPPPTRNEQRAANLRKTFGQGPGLIAIIAVGLVLLLFIGFALRGFYKTSQADDTKAAVGQPPVPNKDITQVEVSPEEMMRRQQVAVEEAAMAAQNNSTYQPGFDVRISDPSTHGTGSGNFQLNVGNTAAQPASAPVTNTQTNQLSEAELAEIRRIEAQRQAEDQERQRLQNEYNQRLQQREQYENTQREVVMAQIDNIFKGHSGYGFNTTVSYLPAEGNNAGANGQYGQDQLSTTGGTLARNPNNQGQGSVAGAGTGQGGCTPVFRTGNTAFAVLDHEINTDAGMNAIGTIMGGAYNGSKVIGAVQMSHGNISLRFTRLAPQDGRNTLSIDAVAMRTSDAGMGMATSINKHTISRYSALIFSSALAGLGQAAQMQQGTVTQLNNGTTVSTSEAATDRQIIGSVAGQVGQAMSNEIGQSFNRQPTYKVARGTGIALFFMNDVCAQ